MRYEYDVLLFGSNRSRPEIGTELSRRGRDGWRVIAGGRADDGNWSFVIERAITEATRADESSQA